MIYCRTVLQQQMIMMSFVDDGLRVGCVHYCVLVSWFCAVGNPNNKKILDLKHSSLLPGCDVLVEASHTKRRSDLKKLIR